MKKSLLVLSLLGCDNQYSGGDGASLVRLTPYTNWWNCSTNFTVNGALSATNGIVSTGGILDTNAGGGSTTISNGNITITGAFTGGIPIPLGVAYNAGSTFLTLANPSFASPYIYLAPVNGVSTPDYMPDCSRLVTAAIANPAASTITLHLDPLITNAATIFARMIIATNNPTVSGGGNNVWISTLSSLSTATSYTNYVSNTIQFSPGNSILTNLQYMRITISGVTSTNSWLPANSWLWF